MLNNTNSIIKCVFFLRNAKKRENNWIGEIKVLLGIQNILQFEPTLAIAEKGEDKKQSNLKETKLLLYSNVNCL